VYIQAWITCPLASDAPVNDLLLYNRIQQYVKTVSDAAIKKLQNHLWYYGCIDINIFYYLLIATQHLLSHSSQLVGV